MTFDESSFEETSKLFTSESEKLKTSIENILQKSEHLTMEEIIQIYYQIINVNAMLQVLKQDIGKTKQQNLSQRLNEMQNLISEKFNEKLHPLVMSQLANSINDFMNNLKSAKKGAHGVKSKEEIEDESKMYEKLRQTMSTKEFVEQYEKGLKYD